MADVDWNKISRQLKKREATAYQMLMDWLKDNDAWRGDLYFTDYPPQLRARLTLDGVNSIGDKRLNDAEKIFTDICEKLQLAGRMKRHGESNNSVIASNELVYILWIPIKEK